MHSTFVRAFTFNDMVTTPRNYIDHLKNERQAQSSLLCSLCLGYTWMSLCSEKKYLQAIKMITLQNHERFNNVL